LLDADFNVLIPPSPTNIVNADLSPIAVREFFVSGGGRAIGLLYSSNGDIVYVTSRSGASFA